MKNLGSNIIRFPLISSFIFSLIFFIIARRTKDIVQSTAINFVTDFIIIGITLSFINKKLDQEQHSRFGDVPYKAENKIKGEYYSLIIEIGFMVKEKLKIDDDAFYDEIVTKVDENTSLSDRVHIAAQVQMENIDYKKMTYEEFSKTLGSIESAVKKIDELIDRYGGFLKPEKRSWAVSLRDSLEDIGKGDLHIFLIRLGSSLHEDKVLSKDEQSSFQRIIDKILRLTSE